MARPELNIFYLISFVCSLLFIGYIWLVFLPIFENSLEYEAVKNMVILITLLFLAVTTIQLYLSMRRAEEPQQP